MLYYTITLLSYMGYFINPIDKKTTDLIRTLRI